VNLFMPIADALYFFGAEISYLARSEKAVAKAKGYGFINPGHV